MIKLKELIKFTPNQRQRINQLIEKLSHFSNSEDAVYWATFRDYLWGRGLVFLQLQVKLEPKGKRVHPSDIPHATNWL
jgi:hypothetical protein